MAKKTNKIARKHHILPRLLLKRFAKDDQVWVTDRISQKSYLKNIEDAACVKDYYIVETTGEVGADCIEQGVLGKIENLVEPVIEKMLQSGAMPKGEDWNILANFLALMYVRGPLLRAMIEEGYEYGTGIVTEHLYSSEETYKAIVGEACQMEITDIDYEEALRARKELELHVDIPNTYHVQQMMDLACLLVPVFAEMTPNLEKIDAVISDARFVISDCPIVPIPRTANPPKERRWLRNRNVDLYFPVSSKACLVLNYDKLRKVTNNVDRRQAALVNHGMALNSERVIISETQNFVWQRENRTIALSHQELLEFLAQSSKGSTIRLDRDSLRQRILKTLRRHKLNHWN